jgi:hypothetical protein
MVFWEWGMKWGISNFFSCGVNVDVRLYGVGATTIFEDAVYLQVYTFAVVVCVCVCERERERVGGEMFCG